MKTKDKVATIKGINKQKHKYNKPQGTKNRHIPGARLSETLEKILEMTRLGDTGETERIDQHMRENKDYIQTLTGAGGGVRREKGR